VAEQSWLGSIWDSITGRDKEPAGNGILNYQPEIKPTEDQGVLSFLGPVGRTLQQAPAELPASFVPSDPNYTPGLSESQFIYNQFLGEPIAKIGEGLEGVAQGFGFARQKEMGGLIPELTQSGKQVVGGSLEFAPVGGPSTMAARKGLLRGAEAVERSPVGQGILAMQEQRGMPMSQMMAGERAATANLEKLDQAKFLMKEGEEPKNIWEKTGWAIGEDGKWRFEIDDSASALSGGQERFDNLLFSRYQQLVREGIKKSDDPVYLEDVFYHPDLYAAYPQLKRAEIEVLPETERAKGKRGGNVIGIRADLGQGEAREIKLHEIQHVIQEIEGFSPGGSWRQFYQDPQELVAKYQTRINELEDLIPEQYGKPGWSELVREREDLMNRQNAAKRMTPEMAQNKAELEYWKMFGEAEARQTSARADMTAEQRAKMFPYKPEDFYWQTGVGLDETSISPPRTTGIFGEESYKPTGLLGQDYRGVHTAPKKQKGVKNTLDDLSDVYPEDVYDPRVSSGYYGHTGAGDPMDRRSAELVAAFQGKPEAEVTIYRAVPEGVTEINPGDWVTLNKNYAMSHGESWVDGGKYSIISKKVKAKDIINDGNSIHEFGYDPD
jgi:hypothetical protein